MLEAMRRLLLAATLLAAAASSQTTFRVPVRVVAVPAAVTAPDGRFVHDLRHADFQLFDNDRPQAFELDYVDEPIALAIVVQANAAVRSWLPHVRRVRSPIEALVIGANGQASVFTFGDGVKTLQTWTRRADLLDTAFGAIVSSIYDKSQALDAVTEAATSLDQVPAPYRRVILLISQAADTGSSATTGDVLGLLERANITLYNLSMPHIGKDLVGKTVRIGSTKGAFGGSDTGIMGTFDLGKLVPEIYRDSKTVAGADAVSIMVAETGGRRIPFKRLRELEAGVSSIGEELHTEYVLTATPDRPDPGYHRLRVEVSQAGLSVRSRPGYYIPDQPRAVQ